MLREVENMPDSSQSTTEFALGAAVLTFLITHNIRSTISVVIVAGACGIAAGTPLAILGAIGRAARQGAIIKGGIYLEALGHLNTIFFDKTGTLTLGAPSVYARALLMRLSTTCPSWLASPIRDCARAPGYTGSASTKYSDVIGTGAAGAAGSKSI